MKKVALFIIAVFLLSAFSTISVFAEENDAVKVKADIRAEAKADLKEQRIEAKEALKDKREQLKEEVKENREQVRENIKQNIEARREVLKATKEKAKEEMKMAREAYQEKKKELQKEKRLEIIKEHLLGTADVLIKIAEQVKAKAEVSEKLTDEESAKIIAEMDERIVKLNESKAKISASATLAEVTEAA